MTERGHGVGVGTQIGVRAARGDRGERHAARLELHEHVGAVIQAVRANDVGERLFQDE